MNITFDEMNATDEYLIRTANSEYRFSVVDPVERRGILSGGSLGGQMRESFLLGTLDGSNMSLACDSSGLKTGARALFYLKAKNGIERLITSVITGIDRIRRTGNIKNAA